MMKGAKPLFKLGRFIDASFFATAVAGRRKGFAFSKTYVAAATGLALTSGRKGALRLRPFALRAGIRANRSPYESPKNFDGKVLQTVALPAATHKHKPLAGIPLSGTPGDTELQTICHSV